ncbi:MAG: hypothetical protein ABI972_14590 [Acidobacteriota bacterium]
MSESAAAVATVRQVERVVCPYRGLTPYAEGDARFFFGRQEDTQLIVANLFSARVTVLFGPSGVGKSSILRAGAIRDLRQRQHKAAGRGERPDLLIVYFRTWQGLMMDELRRTILQDAAELSGRPLNAPAGGTLADLLGYVASTLEVDIMLLLDQFEEYFRYETQFGAPQSFAAQFGEAVGRSSLPVSFLLSLREDSLAELDRFKTLTPNLFTNWFRLERLGLEAAEQAIRGPVEEYNKLPESERMYGGTITLDDGLAAEVLQQVRTGAVLIGDGGRGTARKEQASIETPYLQLVLTELWEEELTKGSKRLRVETLKRLGGAAEIVRRHVETVLGALSAKERQMCGRMFDYLVTDSGAKIAYRAKDLADKGCVDEVSMRTLLGKLAEGDKRILTTVAPAPDHPAEPQYEIYHDSLSRAVIAWRRRYVEGAHRKQLVRRVASVAAVLLLLFLGYGWYRNGQLETAATVAEAQAAKSEAAELKARSQQSAAEAHALALRLKELEEARKGDTEQYKKLQAEANKRIEEAAKYEKAATQVQYQYAAQTNLPSPPPQKTELETERANRAERDRDRYREEAAQLSKDREDLARQLDAFRKSQGAQAVVPTARMEQMMCRLERVRVFEDGSVGDTPWNFDITIKAEGQDPVRVKLPLTLNDRTRPLMVIGKSWPVKVDKADPLVLIEVSGTRVQSKAQLRWPDSSTVHAFELFFSPSGQGTRASGYADGSRPRYVAFLLEDPKDGTVIFEFSLQSGASKK